MASNYHSNQRTADAVWDFAGRIIWLVMIAAAILMILHAAGCSQVTMAPHYAQGVELAAIDIAELNRRCQAGDDEACRKGLAVADETMQLIVDAMHGRTSEGGVTDGDQ